MRVGYQVGHVVQRGTVDHQQQWQDLLAQFRSVNDAGFDSYCYGNHFLIDPFQHFQPWTVLARMAAEPGNMTLATSVLLLPLLNPVEVADQAASLDHISEGLFVLGVGLVLFIRNRSRFYYYRTVVAVSLVFALVAFAIFPVSPPFDTTSQFVDTIQMLGPSLYGGPAMAATYNTAAAMPSLHFCWTVILGGKFLRRLRRWVKLQGW